MTYLEIINRVLVRLRENEVAAVDDSSYSKLIGLFVNDALQDCQEAHTWMARREKVLVTLVEDQIVYDLTATTATTGDVDVGSPLMADDSMLLHDPDGNPEVYYRPGSTTREGYRLTEVSADQIESQERFTELNGSSVGPYHFSVRPGELRVWSKPDASYAGGKIQMSFYTPQPDLALDSTDDDVEIDIPSRPIILGALFYALNERGEEIGEPGGIAEMRYTRALGAAIESDDHGEREAGRYRLDRR
jgi:hypothetical protein